MPAGRWVQEVLSQPFLSSAEVDGGGASARSSPRHCSAQGADLTKFLSPSTERSQTLLPSGANPSAGTAAEDGGSGRNYFTWSPLRASGIRV